MVGKPTVVDSSSPVFPYGAVFEDDGETGYFYALDMRDRGNPIQDAVQIYNVARVADREQPSRLQIVWSTDGAKAGLLLNGVLLAVIDFGARRAVCRTGFPDPSRGWHGHAWDDTAGDLLA